MIQSPQRASLQLDPMELETRAKKSPPRRFSQAPFGYQSHGSIPPSSFSQMESGFSYQSQVRDGVDMSRQTSYASQVPSSYQSNLTSPSVYSEKTLTSGGKGKFNYRSQGVDLSRQTSYASQAPSSYQSNVTSPREVDVYSEKTLTPDGKGGCSNLSRGYDPNYDYYLSREQSVYSEKTLTPESVQVYCIFSSITP